MDPRRLLCNGFNGSARILEYLPYLPTQGRLGACSLDSLQN